MKIRSKALSSQDSHPDHFYGMTVKTHFYQALAISPALFMVYLAVESRTQDGFEPASGMHQQSVVNSYVDLVQQIREAQLKNGTVPVEKARDIARSWVALSEDGTLQPLTPAFYEDSTQSTAKDQIFTAKNLLIRALIGEGAARNETVDVRATDLALAMKLDTSLKYSDFLSVYTCSTDERRMVELLNPLLPKISEPTRQVVKEAVLGIQGSTDKLDHLILLARRQYAESRKRAGEVPISLEESQQMVAVSNEMLGGQEIVRESSTSPSLASLTDMPDYLSSLRLAVNMEKLNNKIVAELRSKL